MTFQGTHFNVEVVLTMTKKQFQLIGGRGNTLTTDQLGQFYDLLKEKDENYKKYAEKRPVGGTERRNAG